MPSNPKIGSIEHVGEDGFIVESADPADPRFYGGKRLFRDFDGLVQFLVDCLEEHECTADQVFPERAEHIKKSVETGSVGGNGKKKGRNLFTEIKLSPRADQ